MPPGRHCATQGKGSGIKNLIDSGDRQPEKGGDNMDAKKCSYCGADFGAGYKGEVCPACGHKLEGVKTPKAPAAKKPEKGMK